MRITSFAGAFAATILAASPAFAVTVTNQDSKPHTVVVNNGKTDTTKTIAAGSSADFPCPQDCGFRDLAFGNSRTVGGNTKLVIDKDGELHQAGAKGGYEMPNGTN